MGASATLAHEKVEVRTARRRTTCWTWRENSGSAPGEGWDGNPPCTRAIAVGEEYVRSTIYPGHDSGYADGGWDARGNPLPPRPVSSSFCMPCARRWVNLKRGLDAIANATRAD